MPRFNLYAFDEGSAVFGKKIFERACGDPAENALGFRVVVREKFVFRVATDNGLDGSPSQQRLIKGCIV